MKMCPCCKSLTFDDMDMCYVCMNRFAIVNLDALGQTNAGSVDEMLDDEVASEGSKQWDATKTISSDVAKAAGAEEQAGARGSSDPFQREWTLRIKMEGFPEYARSMGKGTERLTVGRSSSSDIIVPDLKVSRKHAEFMVSDGRLWVTDCGSKNMTVLDGVPVVGTKEASGRASVEIGSARIEVVPVG